MEKELKEAILLLKDSNQEIIDLRNQNIYMSGRLKMFDDMMLLFKTEPSFPRDGSKEDVVYKSKKFIESKEE